jgi:hypothetical protein
VVYVEEATSYIQDHGTDNAANSGGEEANGNYSEEQNSTEHISTVDPYASFDIQQCGTYEELWIWDLALTCGDSQNSGNCTCEFTEQLMERGLVSCSDARSCPKNCHICSTCLMLAGCPGINSVGSVSAHAGNSGTAAAAVFATLMGICLCFAHNKRSRDKENEKMMKESFIGNEFDKNMHVWMVPLDTAFRRERHRKDGGGSLESDSTGASTTQSDLENECSTFDDVMKESRWLQSKVAVKNIKPVERVNMMLSRTLKDVRARISSISQAASDDDLESAPDNLDINVDKGETNSTSYVIFPQEKDLSNTETVAVASPTSSNEDPSTMNETRGGPFKETEAKFDSKAGCEDTSNKTDLFPNNLLSSTPSFNSAEKEGYVDKDQIEIGVWSRTISSSAPRLDSSIFPDLLKQDSKHSSDLSENVPKSRRDARIGEFESTQDQEKDSLAKKSTNVEKDEIPLNETDEQSTQIPHYACENDSSAADEAPDEDGLMTMVQSEEEDESVVSKYEFSLSGSLY